ncbi:60S ribosomal protein L5, partial [Fukomys damarensis]
LNNYFVVYYTDLLFALGHLRRFNKDKISEGQEDVTRGEYNVENVDSQPSASIYYLDKDISSDTTSSRKAFGALCGVWMESFLSSTVLIDSLDSESTEFDTEVHQKHTMVRAMHTKDIFYLTEEDEDA